MAGYIGTAPVPQATQTREDFTATAGQTTFTTLGYTPGYLDVYLNGVRLQDSDVTATDGSTFQIAACAAGDAVSAIAWSTFDAMNVRYENIIGSPFPSQTGNDGRYLQTDGTNATWQPLTQVQSEVHAFYVDSNGDLQWVHGTDVTALQDANNEDIYDLVIIGSDDQTYSLDASGQLVLTIS